MLLLFLLILHKKIIVILWKFALIFEGVLW